MTPYQGRVKRQTLLWAFGLPQHNALDDECCPDFSCCHPGLFNKDDAKRWLYYYDLRRRYDCTDESAQGRKL